jgi:hypothetical protein
VYQEESDHLVALLLKLKAKFAAGLAPVALLQGSNRRNSVIRQVFHN